MTIDIFLKEFPVFRKTLLLILNKAYFCCSLLALYSRQFFSAVISETID